MRRMENSKVGRLDYLQQKDVEREDKKEANARDVVGLYQMCNGGR